MKKPGERSGLEKEVWEGLRISLEKVGSNGKLARAEKSGVRFSSGRRDWDPCMEQGKSQENAVQMKRQ